MPNKISNKGIEVKNLPDLLQEMKNALRTLYGSDVNFESSTPDGQWINILGTAAFDQLQLIEQIYQSFDPDMATGSVLDQRVAINGIQRKTGTYTVQPVDITTDRTLTLQGLDGSSDDPDGKGYTVADNAGNQWILRKTTTLNVGKNTGLKFRAKDIGPVYPTTNTIKNPVDVVLGVEKIDNPNKAESIGEAEETDAQLRARRRASISMRSAGNVDSLLGALKNLKGVRDAVVYENSDSLPSGATHQAPHSIWIVVDGGIEGYIAEAIYRKKSMGCTMVGDVEAEVVRPNGSTYKVKFDRPDPVDLNVKFSFIPRDSGNKDYDKDAVKKELAAALQYPIHAAAYISNIAVALERILPTHIPNDIQIKKDTDTTWGTSVEAPNQKSKFRVLPENIDITEGA